MKCPHCEKEIKPKKFRLHWKTGNPQIVTGHSIEEACNNAGIGGGAIAALDYYEEVKED